MLRVAKTLLVATIATAMLWPAAAMAQQNDGKRTVSKKMPGAKQTGKKRWRGYGFLPGYEQPPSLSDWRLRSARNRPRFDPYEQRFLYYRPYSGYAQLRYGWGSPGFYRGRWNGGSFGPCWTQTPIGMVWNCGP